MSDWALDHGFKTLWDGRYNHDRPEQFTGDLLGDAIDLDPKVIELSAIEQVRTIEPWIGMDRRNGTTEDEPYIGRKPRYDFVEDPHALWDATIENAWLKQSLRYFRGTVKEKAEAKAARTPAGLTKLAKKYKTAGDPQPADAAQEEYSPEDCERLCALLILALIEPRFFSLRSLRLRWQFRDEPQAGGDCLPRQETTNEAFRTFARRMQDQSHTRDCKAGLRDHEDDTCACPNLVRAETQTPSWVFVELLEKLNLPCSDEWLKALEKALRVKTEDSLRVEVVKQYVKLYPEHYPKEVSECPQCSSCPCSNSKACSFELREQKKHTDRWTIERDTLKAEVQKQAAVKYNSRMFRQPRGHGPYQEEAEPQVWRDDEDLALDELLDKGEPEPSKEEETDAFVSDWLREWRVRQERLAGLDKSLALLGLKRDAGRPVADKSLKYFTLSELREHGVSDADLKISRISVSKRWGCLNGTTARHQYKRTWGFRTRLELDRTPYRRSWEWKFPKPTQNERRPFERFMPLEISPPPLPVYPPDHSQAGKLIAMPRLTVLGDAKREINTVRGINCGPEVRTFQYCSESANLRFVMKHPRSGGFHGPLLPYTLSYAHTEHTRLGRPTLGYSGFRYCLVEVRYSDGFHKADRGQGALAASGSAHIVSILDNEERVKLYSSVGSYQALKAPRGLCDMDVDGAYQLNSSLVYAVMPIEWLTLRAKYDQYKAGKKARQEWEKQKRRGHPPALLTELENEGSVSLRNIRWQENGKWRGFEKDLISPRPDQIEDLADALRKVCALLKKDSLLDDKAVQQRLYEHRRKQIRFSKSPKRNDLDERRITIPLQLTLAERRIRWWPLVKHGRPLPITPYSVSVAWWARETRFVFGRYVFERFVFCWSVFEPKGWRDPEDHKDHKEAVNCIVRRGIDCTWWDRKRVVHLEAPSMPADVALRVWPDDAEARKRATGQSFQ